MKEVLEDTRLVTLQREGGAVLARMRREDFRFPQSEDYRYYIIFIVYLGSASCSQLLSVLILFDLHCLHFALYTPTLSLHTNICSLYKTWLHYHRLNYQMV